MLKTFYSVIQALTGAQEASVVSAKGSTSFLRDQGMPRKPTKRVSKGVEEFKGIKGTIPLAEALQGAFKHV